eukprot:PhF_6_TR26637/c0_g1_i1/m.38578/K01007/pps, ppsA; pyruvate, water dikinase
MGCLCSSPNKIAPRKNLQKRSIPPTSAPPSSVMTLSDCGGAAASVVGGKARNLGIIMAYDLAPVSPGVCVTTNLFEALCGKDLLQELESLPLDGTPDTILEKLRAAVKNKETAIPSETLSALKEFLQNHPTATFAVRSSASMEDSNSNAYAGIMETILNVPNDVGAIVEAIRDVWASSFDLGVFRYWRRTQLANTAGKKGVGVKFHYPRMACVVQVQVDSDVSGVLFTRHPSGAPQFHGTALIEATLGQGQGIADGITICDSYVVSKSTLSCVNRKISHKDQLVRLSHGKGGGVEVTKTDAAVADTTTLSDSQLQQIMDLGLCLEDIFDGKPQDVELCFTKDKKLYVMQSRAITTFEPTFVPKNFPKGCWELETTHFGKPLPRIMKRYPQTLTLFIAGFKRYGTMLEKIDMWISDDGFLYTCPRPVGAPAEPTSPPPGFVLNILTRVHPELRARARNAKHALTNRIWVDDIREFKSVREKANVEKNLSLADIDFDKTTDADLVVYVHKCVENALNMLDEHHRYTLSVTFPVGRFLSFLEGYHVTSMEGLQTLCAPENRTALGLSRVPLLAAAASDATFQAKLNAVPQDNAEALKFIEETCRRKDDLGQHFSASWREVRKRILGGFTPRGRTYEDEPLLYLKQLITSLHDKSDDNMLLEHRMKAKALKESKIPVQDHGLFDAMYEDALSAYGIRDRRGLCCDALGNGVLNLALREAGRRCVKKGYLSHVDDFIEIGEEEIEPFLLRGEGVTGDELARRREYYNTFSWQDSALHLGPRGGPPPDPRSIPGPLGEVAACMGGFMKNMFSPATNVMKSDAVIEGVSAGVPGVYVGTARCVPTEDLIPSVLPGEVVIVTTTSSAYNSVISICGALVAECSGVLAHAAITARENHKPCVVMAQHALKVIKTGDTVKVDGDKGIVSVVKKM